MNHTFVHFFSVQTGTTHPAKAQHCVFALVVVTDTLRAFQDMKAWLGNPAKAENAEPENFLHCEQWQYAAYLKSSSTAYSTAPHKQLPLISFIRPQLQT
jgi:hypothetical protein